MSSFRTHPRLRTLNVLLDNTKLSDQRAVDGNVLRIFPAFRICNNLKFFEKWVMSSFRTHPRLRTLNVLLDSINLSDLHSDNRI